MLMVRLDEELFAFEPRMRALARPALTLASATWRDGEGEDGEDVEQCFHVVTSSGAGVLVWFVVVLFFRSSHS